MKRCVISFILVGLSIGVFAVSPPGCDEPLVWTPEPACRIHQCQNWLESLPGTSIICEFPPEPGCFCPDDMPLQLIVDGEVTCVTELECLATTCRRGELPTLCGVPDACTATCECPAPDVFCPTVCVPRCQCKPNKPLWDPTRERCVRPDQCKPCMLATKVGPCEAAIPRWSFQKYAGCQEFSWGGCFPNANNFETQEACVDECGPPCPIVDCFFSRCPAGFKTIDFRGCQTGCKCNCPCKRMDCGPGDVCVVNSATGDAACVKEICAFGQSDVVLPGTCALVDCAPGYSCMEMDGYATCCPNSICSLAPDSGCGKKFWERWYYDPLSGGCTFFLYGGSFGNENNFETETECLDQCAPAP